MAVAADKIKDFSGLCSVRTARTSRQTEAKPLESCLKRVVESEYMQHFPSGFQRICNECAKTALDTQLLYCLPLHVYMDVFMHTVACCITRFRLPSDFLPFCVGLAKGMYYALSTSNSILPMLNPPTISRVFDMESL